MDTDCKTDPVATGETLVIQTLELVARDATAPAAARVQAARTLAEINGQLGKHQTEPARQNRSAADMTVDEINAELDGTPDPFAAN